MFSVSVAALCACATDHDGLAKRPGGAVAGNAGASGQASGGQNGGGRAGAGTGGKPDFEPIGESVFTIVHGMVDARVARLCFAKLNDDAEPEWLPGPSPELRLSYGARVVVPALSGIDVANEPLQLFVIEGQLELTDGLSCASAVERAEAEEAASTSGGEGGAGGGQAGASGASGTANAGAGGSSGDAGASGNSAAGQGGASGEPPPDPPRLRARALPVIPAGVLSGGRSYLLVLAGCLGGPAFTHASQSAVCGADYSPTAPTLRPILVNMSRVTAALRLGLQTLNGSVANDEIATRAVRANVAGDSGSVIAASVSSGEISPKPPNIAAAAADYGAGLPDWSVEVLDGGVTMLSEPWPTVLQRGALPTLEDGKTYALIFIGPGLDVEADSWWHAPALTIAPTAP